MTMAVSISRLVLGPAAFTALAHLGLAQTVLFHALAQRFLHPSVSPAGAAII